MRTFIDREAHITEHEQRCCPSPAPERLALGPVVIITNHKQLDPCTTSSVQYYTLQLTHTTTFVLKLVNI